mgnify:CR=1 FL=1
MHEDFWQERWARNEIGFHLREVNPYLQRHWPDLGLAAGAQVLVPLCGKSLDMAWLAGQGYRVLGVELAESAVIAFFAEQELTPEVDQYGAFRRYRAGAVELLCGDFFALQAADVAACAGLYDRAALIALPQEMRSSYLSVLHGDATAVTMLSNVDLDRVVTTDEDDADVAVGFYSKPYRKQNQWEQHNYNDLYLVNVKTGERKLIAKKIRSGNISPKGKFAAEVER